MARVWYENPEGAAPAQGLYSHAGLSQGGALAFVAGQLSVGLDGSVVGAGDFAAQFEQVTLLIVDRLVKEEFEIEVEAIVAVDR